MRVASDARAIMFRRAFSRVSVIFESIAAFTREFSNGPCHARFLEYVAQSSFITSTTH